MAQAEGGTGNYYPPATYTQWQDDEIKTIQDDVLKASRKNMPEDDAKKLITALAYKAVHVTEVGATRAAKFDTNDASAAYTCVFTQCTQNKSMEEKLYQYYGQMWEDYLHNVVAPATAAPETNAEKLVELSKRYKHFMTLLKKIWSKQMFLYLDRFYTPKKNLPTTRLVGYQKWRQIIFAGKESGVQEAVLDLIYKDREGEPVDRDQLKTVIRIWVDCGLKQVTSNRGGTNANQTGPKEETSYEMYEEDFEKPFLQQTGEYYQTKSNQWTQEDTFPDYMRKAEGIYEDEKDRRRTFLDETTEVKLLEVIDDKLIGDHQKKLAMDPDTGFVKLLEKFNLQDTFEAANVEDLSRVYRMFERLKQQDDHDGIQPLATMTREFITQVGQKIVDECGRHILLGPDGKVQWAPNGKPKVEDNLKSIIHKLCNRYELYQSLMQNVFNSDPRFMKALKEAFVSIMSLEHVTAPEYTDQKGVPHQQRADGAEVKLSDEFADLLSSRDSDEVVLHKIDICVQLFGHLSQKDAFISFHMRHLAQRLLVNKSVNPDWEQQTVQWLQNHVGARMVNSMGVMLQDMQAQENLDVVWSNATDYCTQGSVDDIKTAMKVLTFGKWPNYRPINVTLHPQMTTCFDQFGQWYRSTKPKTLLEPLYGLSTVEMVLWFVGPRKKICSMNVPMACILMLFANDPNLQLTVKDIQDQVKYDKKDVEHDLYEMTHNRDSAKNLMTHHQVNKQLRGFSPDDKISLNAWYRPSPQVKIDFVEFKAQIADSDMEHIYREIAKNRQCTIDACLVRIAKREGKQKKQQFLAKVIKELASFFPCPAQVVDMRIKRLVDGTDTGPDGILLKYNESTDEYEYNADGK
jgi:cullin 1